MQEWMDTRATYGNNPYMKTKPVKKKKRTVKTVVEKPVMKPRSLFEWDNTMSELENEEATNQIIELNFQSKENEVFF